MNASTTRRSPTAADSRAGRGLCAPAAAPFAALPHDIAADPRLSPTDVRVLLALLFYARSKAACWPSDRSLGLRVGRSIGTVQRALRRLETFGLVGRLRADNPTGRQLVLRWRSTPTAPALDPPASAARDKGRRERERERPESAAGIESPPPPAGDGGQEPDLATLHQWADGPDPILRRIAGRRLAELAAGVEAMAAAGPIAEAPAVESVESVESPPAPAVAVEALAPAVAPRPTGSTGRAPAPPCSQGLPRRRATWAGRQAGPAGGPRPDRGQRHGPGRSGPVEMTTALAGWLARRAP